MLPTPLSIDDIVFKNLPLTPEQMKAAADAAGQRGISLRDAVVMLGFATDSRVCIEVARALTMPYASRENRILQPEKEQGLERLISAGIARENLVLPLFRDEGALAVAFAGTDDPAALAERLKTLTRCDIQLFIAPKKQILETIDEFYGNRPADRNVAEPVPGEPRASVVTGQWRAARAKREVTNLPEDSRISVISFVPDPGATNAGLFATLAAGLKTGDDERNLPEIGTRIHHYELISEIGHGATSAVFKAKHAYLSHTVAIKTLLSCRARGNYSELFLREASVLARLKHENVVQAIDAGVADSRPYIAMEYVGERTLAKLVHMSGPLDIDRALEVLELIGDVLVKQEELGILHRDVKPANIVERNNGSFCLIDYGLVGFVEGGKSDNLRGGINRKATMEGRIFGTPAYMPPEQALQKTVDNRSDLFSLGCSVWSCLAGTSPRSGGPEAVLRQAAQDRIPPIREHSPWVPAEVESILLRMTELDPRERYQSAGEMLEDLRRYRHQGKRPSRATKGTAFLAIPYVERFDPVCQALEEASEAASLRLRRVDRLQYTGNVLDKMMDEIRRARVVIADFSCDKGKDAPNANVLTEAAYALALGKPLIVISQDDLKNMPLPFDWRSHKVEVYENSEPGLRRLTESLTPQLKKFLTNLGDKS